MFVIEFLAKLFKILRSEDSPNKIAAGFAMGMIIGLTPLLTLHNFILFVLIIVIKVNMATAIFGFVIFSGLAYLFDPLFHSFGYFLLVDLSSLKGLWTALYNLPVIALSRYNNTVVTGSLVVSVLMIIPVFLFAKYFVAIYREKIDPKFQKLKIVQIVKTSKFYTIYEKIKIVGD